MKKIVILTALSVIILMLTQCAKKISTVASKTTTTTTTTKSVAETAAPGNSDVAAAKKVYTPEELEHGKAIFQSSCGKCHDLPHAEGYTIASWENILPGMCYKAKLVKADAGMVHAWVIANAKKEGEIPGIPH